MNRRLLLPLMLTLAACTSTPRFDDGSGHARPLAAWLVQGFAGRYALACDDGRQALLLVSAEDGSVRLGGQVFVGSGGPGDLVLEGNGGSPAHSEPDRIGYGDNGQPGALQVPAYPATLSLTVHRRDAGGMQTVALVRDLGGGPPRITIGDGAASRSCRIGSTQNTGSGSVSPGWLMARLAQRRDVACHNGLEAGTRSGVFAITREGVVQFPDGRQWPVAPEAAVDWNFQLQDAGSFGDGGYRLLLDSDVTPRSLLGREAVFDREGLLRELHYLDAGGNSVDCRAF